MNTKSFIEEITAKIEAGYQDNIPMHEAEKLAGEFLHIQLVLSSEITSADLDSRMKRSGVKAIRAAIYLEEASKGDKKPSDIMLQALVDRNEIVIQEQKSFDEAEVWKNELERVYNVCQNAHIFYRGVAKGGGNIL